MERMNMTDNDIDEEIEEVTNELPRQILIDMTVKMVDHVISNDLLQTIDDLHDDEEYEGVA